MSKKSKKTKKVVNAPKDVKVKTVKVTNTEKAIADLKAIARNYNSKKKSNLKKMTEDISDFSNNNYILDTLFDVCKDNGYNTIANRIGRIDRTLSIEDTYKEIEKIDKDPVKRITDEFDTNKKEASSKEPTEKDNTFTSKEKELQLLNNYACKAIKEIVKDDVLQNELIKFISFAINKIDFSEEADNNLFEILKEAFFNISDDLPFKYIKLAANYFSDIKKLKELSDKLLLFINNNKACIINEYLYIYSSADLSRIDNEFKTLINKLESVKNMSSIQDVFNNNTSISIADNIEKYPNVIPNIMTDYFSDIKEEPKEKESVKSSESDNTKNKKKKISEILISRNVVLGNDIASCVRGSDDDIEIDDDGTVFELISEKNISGLDGNKIAIEHAKYLTLKEMERIIDNHKCA